jgi:uridine kinase
VEAAETVPVSVVPLSTGRQVEDIAVLARNDLFGALSVQELGILLDALDQVALPRGAAVMNEGEEGEYAYVVLDGQAHELRGATEVRTLGPSDSFGEIALAGVKRRASSVEALSTLRLARLSLARFLVLAEAHPLLSQHLLGALAKRLGTELAQMTDRVGLLLRERSLPRRALVTVALGDASVPVATGTRVGDFVPKEVNGARVVGALLDDRPVSLDAPLVSDARVAPVSMATWDGREIHRRSVALVLLEAAYRVAPSVTVRMGASLTSGRVIEVTNPDDTLAELAARIERGMKRIVAEGPAFREELWTVEEARAHFDLVGWDDAAALLKTWRDATVPLASCGDVYALADGPLLPTAAGLEDFRVVTHPDGLLLDFGPPVKRHVVAATLRLEQITPRFGGEMTLEEKRWLAALGVTSVGSFDEQCVNGNVRELVRVCEGFHEKRIGRIADAIDARRDAVKVIAIAGPSSSGKTTFIKRLTVQLEIVGLRPTSLSLDDYYVDRDKTVRDEKGEYDFEALEAIDRGLLGDHIARLLAGETVKTARYDFVKGKSEPEGGKTVRLAPGDVLLVEGIHGLNPALFGHSTERLSGSIFRVFVHPATALALDRLSGVSPSDVRLVRRLVRDRHQRNYQANETIARWPSVRRGEMLHIFPFQSNADQVFDSSLVYEMGVLKVFAERYLLEVPRGDPAFSTAYRLRRLLDKFVAIYPDHVPPTSILREFIGGSGFEY